MSKKTKAIILAVCAVILVVASVAGTMAYLTAQTAKVSNTFTAGKGLFEEPATPQPTQNPQDPKPLTNGLHLLETKLKTEEDGSYSLDTGKYTYGNSYTVVPGMTIPKDPAVFVVGKTDTPAYLFIEVVGTIDDTVLTYAINSDNWTKLDDATPVNEGATVYVYKNSTKVTTDLTAAILNENAVKVSSTASKEEIDDAVGNLEFYAYMCQSATFDSAAAAFNACFGVAE